MLTAFPRQISASTGSYSTYSVGFTTSSYSSIVSTASIYSEEEVCNINVDIVIRGLDHDVDSVMIQGSVLSSLQLKPVDISIVSGKPSTFFKAPHRVIKV